MRLNNDEFHFVLFWIIKTLCVPLRWVCDCVSYLMHYIWNRRKQRRRSTRDKNIHILSERKKQREERKKKQQPNQIHTCTKEKNKIAYTINGLDSSRSDPSRAKSLRNPIFMIIFKVTLRLTTTWSFSSHHHRIGIRFAVEQFPTHNRGKGK